MSLLQADFDADYDLDNVDGVMFGDIYYLNYYGINVFFYVCRIDHHRVAVFELAKKKAKLPKTGECVEFIHPKLKPARSPLVVLENNCWTKSNFWVDTNKEKQLIIPVAFLSPLYNCALDLGIELPMSGEYCAVPLTKEQDEGTLFTFYWDVPKKAKNKNKNKIDISA